MLMSFVSTKQSRISRELTHTQLLSLSAIVMIATGWMAENDSVEEPDTCEERSDAI